MESNEEDWIRDLLHAGDTYDEVQRLHQRWLCRGKCTEVLLSTEGSLQHPKLTKLQESDTMLRMFLHYGHFSGGGPHSRYTERVYFEHSYAAMIVLPEIKQIWANKSNVFSRKVYMLIEGFSAVFQCSLCLRPATKTCVHKLDSALQDSNSFQSIAA